MSEQTAESSATETEGAESTEQKPTETVDFWKQKAREQERRAKENAKAAERLAAIEEANKTETQKAADALAAAQREAEEARAEALRYRIASKFQIGDEDAALFLTASDEETLTAQAQRLSDREAERKKQGNHVPNEGRKTPAVEGDDRAAVRALFGGD